MLQNFLLTVNVVIPIFIFIFIGFILKETKIFSKEATDALSAVVFSLLLPANLIRNLMYSDLSSVFNVKLLAFIIILSVISVSALWVTVPKFVLDKKEAGSFIQCTFRANIVLMGLALAGNMCGEEGAAVMTSLIAFLVPVLNVISVIVLSNFSCIGGASVKKVAVNIAKNPLIIGCLIGIAISFWQIPLHPLIENTIIDLSDCSMPLAMLLIGGQFDTKQAIAHVRIVLAACAVKLIILPALATAAGYFLGFRGAELACIFAVSAAPSAASSAIQAQAEGCDGAMAGEILLMTTFLSVFTLFVGIFTLYSLGIIAV